ncbi:MAG: InlB B-repeat-containing protein, partial [Synergistaceae bacterium]|nr:InlB B-repeat-containing protein [Synergistaceae bacterium]
MATIYGPDWKLKKNIDFYTISFNANGGKVTAKTKEVSNGAFYGVLPIPTKKGKVFDGWYTK